MGGRKKGSRNAFSAALRHGLVEATYRLGVDGTGRHGVIGYFMWVAMYHPDIFMTEILFRVLLMQLGASADPPLPTADEFNRAIEAYLELAPTPETAGTGRTADPEIDWTARADVIGALTDVGGLMQGAVRAPRQFCRLWGMAFMTAPKHLRGADRRAWGTSAHAE
jgi:hypothetical protein